MKQWIIYILLLLFPFLLSGDDALTFRQKIAQLEQKGVKFADAGRELKSVPPNYKERVLELPDGVLRIGSRALNRCRNIHDVILPQSVTLIGKRAFEKSGIKNITIPKSVQTIEDMAFRECKNLMHIKLEQGVVEIGERAFSGCEKLEAFVMPNTVQKLGDRVFENCTNMKSATLSLSL